MKNIADVGTYTRIDSNVDIDTGKGTDPGACGIGIYLTMKTCFF